MAWVLFGIGALVLLAGVPMSLSYWDVYGTPDSFGEWWGQSWWILVVVAIPALGGYLVLRIARDRTKSRSRGD